MLWIGLGMALMQVFGAYLGSSLAIKKGAVVIKPLLVFSTLAMAINLLLTF
jgi:uncharacterized membrane protein YfcA